MHRWYNLVKEEIAIDRKQFSTSIDKDIAKNFKVKCVENDVNMNDVLEEFMKAYVAGTIKIKIPSKGEDE